jgi:hypothetical protein
MDERGGSGPTRIHGDDADFRPGERVEFLPDGVTGTIRVSAGGFSHVVWDDERELGGSRVANENLRRVPDATT